MVARYSWCGGLDEPLCTLLALASHPHLHEVLHGDGLLHVVFAHLPDLCRRLASNLAPHAVHGGVTTDVGDVVTTAAEVPGAVVSIACR